MPITILDGIVIAVMLFSAVLAMVRGFSREVLSVVSWVLAAAAAYFFYPDLTPLASRYTQSPPIAMIGSAAIIFIVVLVVVSLITMKIADFVIDSRIGPLDRVLGFVFGALRGLLLIVVAMMFFNWLVPKQQPDWVAEAKTKPMIDSLGQRLENALPRHADTKLMDTLRGKDDDSPDTPDDNTDAQ
ncbi:CvpA family protein [Pararhizobium mangrovi]|uniref:CvpA family protein n=1 Tax=Pararhizobium mangrovi TaxID=2590452 RepID=A0A506UEF8_9HYPH|nr:CvpA family protein [Pararhizobium mangrovi]TPW32028.1 CvpA family protein [Pararhizobium mangrovi]